MRYLSKMRLGAHEGSTMSCFREFPLGEGVKTLSRPSSAARSRAAKGLRSRGGLGAFPDLQGPEVLHGMLDRTSMGSLRSELGLGSKKKIFQSTSK